jgi:hypothetical protein
MKPVRSSSSTGASWCLPGPGPQLCDAPGGNGGAAAALYPPRSGPKTLPVGAMAKRPGSKAAAELFQSDEPTRWAACLGAYESCVRAKQGKTPTTKHLAQDDTWLRTVLPQKLRSSQCLSHADMSRVCRWKLARGKWRPLQKMVDSNSADAVEQASGQATAALRRGQVQAALKLLSKGLRGVGPATASAVLAAHSPELAPFMADEAMEAVPGLQRACASPSVRM